LPNIFDGIQKMPLFYFLFLKRVVVANWQIWGGSGVVQATPKGPNGGG
jgi:hypothetical protein